MSKAKESIKIKSISCIFSTRVRPVIDKLFCTALPSKPMRVIEKSNAKITANNANVAATRLFRTNTKTDIRWNF